MCWPPLKRGVTPPVREQPIAMNQKKKYTPPTPIKTSDAPLRLFGKGKGWHFEHGNRVEARQTVHVTRPGQKEDRATLVSRWATTPA